MQRVLGIPQPEPAGKGEAHWIEHLQQRPLPPASPAAPSVAVDAAESGLWIRRLQQRAGNRPL